MTDQEKTKKPESKAPNPREERTENIIAILVVVLIFGGVGFWIYHVNTAQPALPQTARLPIPVGNSPMLGSEEAPVTVVIFSDFECPFCAQFAKESMPQIIERYVDTNMTSIVFKHYPISSHQHSMLAAQAAVCAAQQQKFWEYHDLLFDNQEKLLREDLVLAAAAVGLDSQRFLSCIDAVEGIVVADRDLGTSVGVTGTPTFYFNGRKVAGALSADGFGEELAKELS